MGGVTILVANPAARVVRLRDAEWIVAAANAGEIVERLAASEAASVRLPGELVPMVEDGTVVRIDAGGGIEAFRSINSHHELYLTTPSDGSLILSDTFHDALASLPPGERELAPTALLDHLAFVFVPADATHLARVKRLGRGDLLEVRRDGNRSLRTVDRLVVERGEASVPEAAASLGEALREAVSGIRTEPALGNMLSGGIDSTLLQYFLGRGVRSLSVAVDSPEFAFEIGYARHASELLGSRHQLVELAETRLLAALERVIDELAFPPSVVQIAMIPPAFDTGFQTFVGGEDAYLFTSASRRVAARDDAAPADQDPAMSRQLSLALDDPCGFALEGAAASADLGLVKQLFGDDRVADRVAARYRHARERMDLRDEQASQRLRHLEMATIIGWLAWDTPSHWRQLAIRNGRAIVFPYFQRGVLASVLSVPVEDRYRWNGTLKPIPKQLLTALVPGFDTEVPKGGSGLPRTRYLDSGPLRQALAAYPLPGEFDPAHHHAVLPVRWESSWTLFALLTFSMWQRRVLQSTGPNLSAATRQIRGPGLSVPSAR